MVSSGTSDAPYGPDRKVEAVSCSIQGFTNEDASISMIRKWVGVKPNLYSSAGLTYYDYREDGAARTAIIDNAASKTAMGEGKAWLLTIILQPNSASVQLMHFKAPTPRNSN